MVISPNDFSLWARLTGNKYPSTPRERAQKGPEVQRFIQNLDKEGMLGGKQEEQKKRKEEVCRMLIKVLEDAVSEDAVSEVKKIKKDLDKNVMKVFNVKNSVDLKTSYGGTSTKNIKKMLSKLKKEFK